MDKNLIAYAYLAQTKRDDGDLVSGLMPIFKPIAKELAGKTFDPHQFADLARKHFGLKVNPLVAQDLKPRLERAGIIEKKFLTKTEFEHIYSCIDEEFNDIKEEHIKVLLDGFCDYIEKHSSLLEEVGEDYVKNFFIEYITDLDFAKKFLHSGKRLKRNQSEGKFGKILKLKKQDDEELEEEIEPEGNFYINAKIAKLSSSYIYETKENNSEIFELIIKLCAGSLVSEAVLNFQNPQTNVSLKGVYCILDTPFLMSALDLSEKDKTESARLILETLKANGARVAVYKHTLEELSINLEGVRQHFENGQGYRATARRMHQPEFKDWFDEVRARPENVLKHSGIEVLRDTQKNIGASSYSFFSEEQESVLYGKLTHVENPAARDKDAKSIAETIRRRGGITAGSNDITKAKIAFITGNSLLAQKSKEFCIREGIYDSRDFPPAVTDKYLAGLLWVIFGGAAEDLPKLSLLANCASTLEPNNETAIKMLDLLGGLDEGKANYFKALMTSDRACHYLAVVSLDGPESIDKDNIGEILENMEAEFSSKHKKEADELAQRHKEEKDKLEQQARENIKEVEKKSEDRINELKARHSELETSTTVQNKEITALSDQLEKLKEEIGEEKTKLREKEINKAQKCLEDASSSYIKSKRNIHITVGAILLFAGPASATLATSNLMIQVAAALPGAVISAFSFWEAPSRIFDRKLRNKRRKMFENLMVERHVDIELTQLKVDWESNEVRYAE